MKSLKIFFFLFGLAYTHNIKNDTLNWNFYSRVGAVNTINNYGLASYLRLKRTTNHNFRDVRFYTNIFGSNQDIRLRHKSSKISFNLPWFYHFNTVAYQKNSLIDINLRYHYNQGFGYLLKRNNKNITLEIGIAYDVSDYLENTLKTSYAKSAFTYDQNFKNVSTKLEIERFSQISDEIDNTNLSRYQLMLELNWNFYKRISIISGIYQEASTSNLYTQNNRLISYLTLAFKSPLKWML
tara:strand:+ start:2774 stop:3490 length:717 start_codon:yes stop_codon:yes gene_type:complete